MKTIALALVLAVSAVSSATVLTFDDLSLTNYGAIPQYYGDNVTSTNSGPSGSYLEGNGWTPDVTTSYDTVDGANSTGQMDFWDSGYGDLTNVVFPSVSTWNGMITLSPTNGKYVVLDSFDMAGWPFVDRYCPVLRILDGATHSVIVNLDGTLIAGANGHTHFSFGGFSSTTGYTLEWGGDWNIGMDNISFHESDTAVPEPATMAALGMGLLAIRRRAKK
ncbi:MAG: PEP-CTERM sorting domain-containing protein [Armatimonadetes bacterium]|nr:PEP-CTERM sorting domain-containing protein [Armatimonadota bacterium]